MKMNHTMNKDFNNNIPIKREEGSIMNDLGYQSNTEEEISLSEIFAIIKPYIIYILLFSVILGLGSFLFTKVAIQPVYQSNATMIINNRKDDAANAITSDEINTARNLASVYSIIIKSDAVTEPVVEALGLDLAPQQLAEMITVSSVDNTQVIRISVKNIDPELAQALNQEILNVAPDIIVDVVEGGSARVISYPQIPESPVSPNVVMNVLVAFMLGMMLSTGYVFVRFMLDKTFKTQQEIEKVLGIPVIGVIPNVQSVRKGGK